MLNWIKGEKSYDGFYCETQFGRFKVFENFVCLYEMSYRAVKHESPFQISDFRSIESAKNEAEFFFQIIKDIEKQLVPLVWEEDGSETEVLGNPVKILFRAKVEPIHNSFTIEQKYGGFWGCVDINSTGLCKSVEECKVELHKYRIQRMLELWTKIKDYERYIADMKKEYNWNVGFKGAEASTQEKGE